MKKHHHHHTHETPSNTTTANTNSTPNASNVSVPTFITAYGAKLQVQTHFTGPGRTKQSFKDECDINNIMARYQKNGVIDFVSKHQARYGDVTGLDFETNMQQIRAAQSMFNDLPSDLRTRFENNPAKFLDFVHDPANASEMHEMGLMRPDYQPTPTDAATAPVANPQTSVESNPTAEGGTAKA